MITRCYGSGVHICQQSVNHPRPLVIEIYFHQRASSSGLRLQTIVSRVLITALPSVSRFPKSVRIIGFQLTFSRAKLSGSLNKFGRLGESLDEDAYVDDDVTSPAGCSSPPFVADSDSGDVHRSPTARWSVCEKPGLENDVRAALRPLFYRYFAVEQAHSAVHRGHSQWP